MGQDELMKSSFDANIGTVGTTGSSSTTQKLDLIIDKLEEINNTLNKAYNFEPEVKEDIPEVNEEIINTPETPVEEPVAEATEVPTEEASIEEDTFTPVNVDVMPIEEKIEEVPAVNADIQVEEPVNEELDVEEVNDDSNVMSIDEMLASGQTDEAPIEEPVVEVPYEEPITTPAQEAKEEPIVTPIEETPIQPVEIPDLEVTPAIESVATEEVNLDAPMVETDPIGTEPIPTTEPVPLPTEPVTLPIEPTTDPVPLPVEPTIETTPTIENSDKKYKIVTDLYVGMTGDNTEVKTEGQHRTLTVTNNEKIKSLKQEDKILVMSNAA